MIRSILLFSLLCFAHLTKSQTKSDLVDSIKYIQIQGKVVDAIGGKPLAYATLNLKNSTYTNVCNSQGEFVFKIPNTQADNSIEIKQLGYKTAYVKIATYIANKSTVIPLELEPLQLKGALVRPNDPAAIIKLALAEVKNNYATHPYNATAFYREIVKRNSKYLSLAEAVLDVYKTGYTDETDKDAMGIYKGRKSSNFSSSDSILFKYQGGITTATMLDVMRYFEIISADEPLSNSYNFSFADHMLINGRTHYVIKFEQKPSADLILYRGTFYIDMDKLAVARVEFNMNVENNPKAADLFIVQKPKGTKFTMESVAYYVDYYEQNEKWYYNYSRAELKFKCKREGKRLFNFSATGFIMSEIAITDRSFTNVHKIPAKKRVKSTDILIEKLTDFTDVDFWGSYNVIEPDQSIDVALKRLSRSLKKKMD